MSGRRLKTFVHVDGVAYGPHDQVPDKVARRIGDHAWETAPAYEGEHDPETLQVPGDEPVAPPRSGRGSGIEAWREFAEKNDIEVPAEASRDDIIAACEAAELIEREE